jgi:hypothetical protein
MSVCLSVSLLSPLHNSDIDLRADYGIIYLPFFIIIIISLLMSPVLIDYTLGERAITHDAGPLRIGGC